MNERKKIKNRKKRAVNVKQQQKRLSEEEIIEHGTTKYDVKR